MSKLGIANGTGPGLGSMRRSHHDGSAEQHRNGLTKKRSYGSLQRCSTTADTMQAPRTDVAAGAGG